MASLLPVIPHTSLSRTKISSPLPHRTHPFSGGFLVNPKPLIQREIGVVQLGLRPDSFLFDSDGVIGELFGRAESLLYTIADAAVSSSDTVNGTTKQSGDWLSGITYYMESILKVLKDGLSTLHVPYAYGFAIILLTVIVKAATYPLTKKQVESAMAMRSLQPQIKAIQQRYAGNQERIQMETARLYKLAGINPLAGCLPTLATIPVWIGLYRALSNVADEGLLSEGFFWIPSLAGPTTVAARQNGSGISWLFPFIDSHPPLGWSNTLAYLVLPVLIVVSQYISMQIMQSSQSDDPNMKNSQAITKFLPLMIGYFSLSVPSGLSLYWFTNNILSTAQQVWLQKLGGAQNPVRQLDDDTVKEEPPQIAESAPEIKGAKEISGQGEKLTSGSPRPGERFKQLKEQEARRRKQREEEKRKVEEVAPRGVQSTNEGHQREDITIEGANGAGADDKNGAALPGTTNAHSTDGGVVLNGSHSSQQLKQDNKMASIHRTEDTEPPASSEGDGTIEQPSYDDVDKEAAKIYSTTAATDNKFHNEDSERPA